MKKIIYLLLPLIFFGTACTSISSMQDARTTKKGTFVNAIGVGNIGAKVTSSGSTGVKGDAGTTVSIPMIEYMLRYGLADSLDIGVRTSLWAHGLDLKYNLVDGGFGLAVGAGAQYMSFEVTSGSTTNKFTVIDLTPSIFLNFKISEGFVLYLVPKMVSRQSSDSDPATSDTSITYTGGSVGLSFGQQGGFFVEGTAISAKDDTVGENVTVSQIGIGFKF